MVFIVAHKAMTVTKVQNQVPTRHHVFHRSCLSCASCHRALHMSNLLEGPGEHKFVLIMMVLMLVAWVTALDMSLVVILVFKLFSPGPGQYPLKYKSFFLRRRDLLQHVLHTRVWSWRPQQVWREDGGSGLDHS